MVLWNFDILWKNYGSIPRIMELGTIYDGKKTWQITKDYKTLIYNRKSNGNTYIKTIVVLEHIYSFKI